MDIIKLTRELGAAIQQDERYAKFQAAQKANDEDKELNDLMGKIQLVHMSYQHEASKEDANEQKLAAYEAEFNDLYKKVMENENMRNYEVARVEIDEMMQYITSILALCVQGEDPATCEPHQEHNCGGNCSSCSGC
ncbi:MAG: YlbF family regulator [Clostridia bacterium]|nr:YlbF family regulator [Clostridia bacterium]MBQ7046767.1 YlbF family regulator [Oscillospiraceae bacterium]